MFFKIYFFYSKGREEVEQKLIDFGWIIRDSFTVLNKIHDDFLIENVENVKQICKLFKTREFGLENPSLILLEVFLHLLHCSLWYANSTSNCLEYDDNYEYDGNNSELIKSIDETQKLLESLNDDKFE